MTNMQYILITLALNVLSVFPQTIVESHPDNAVGWFGLIVVITLILLVACQRLETLGYSRWWCLITFIPFGWIAIAFFKPRAIAV